MTINKTYETQIEHPDGSIDNVYVKALSLSAADSEFQKRYPDLYTTGTAERLSKSIRFRTSARNVFVSGSNRGGQYLYRRKGRKIRSQRNYPNPKEGWSRLGKRTFTWTQSYSQPTTEALRLLANQLAELRERICQNYQLPESFVLPTVSFASILEVSEKNSS